MFKKWKHGQIRRTPTVNKISNYLPYLNSNLRSVVNVVFFLLGDFRLLNVMYRRFETLYSIFICHVNKKKHDL
jgi:hypothetical protein